MTRVYLLRHGATAANLFVPYKLQGRGSDLPLDEIGRQQAVAAGSALLHVSFSAIYSSPLRRAMQTAEAVARFHGLTPIAESELTEGDVGRWEGLTWDEAKAQDPDLYREFFANPGITPYPDGESFLDVQQRATPAIEQIAALHEDASIAIVGHNILNRAYLASVLGLPIAQAREIKQSNGGINLIEIEPGGRSVLYSLNSTLHLDRLTHAGSPG